ncbi:hypothetical protein HBB16_10480 [Pseudonocardia sp. MCCB 268]|nr:hypothetical protein [Pseudonocardia cytotoxica]
MKRFLRSSTPACRRPSRTSPGGAGGRHWVSSSGPVDHLAFRAAVNPLVGNGSDAAV